MRRLFLVLAFVSLLLSSLLGEVVQQKNSLGLGGGFYKPLAQFDYMTLGQLYGGQLKYGVTNSLELGLAGYYGWNYPSEVLDRKGNDDPHIRKGFPKNIRNAETGVLYTGSYDNDGARPYDERSELAFSRNENIPIRMNYLPIEFFVHFRSMTQTAFNPYVVFGGGYIMWEVKDFVNKDQMVEVFYKDEWREFKGSHFEIMFGLGAEVFPVPQVGIQFGLNAQIPFKDDFATYATDTLRMKVDARLHLNFYYGGVKDSDKDGVFDKDDKCPDTPFGAIVDEVGCPMDSDGDGVYDGLDQCPRTPLNASVDARVVRKIQMVLVFLMASTNA
jgi:hypothetical protein